MELKQDEIDAQIREIRLDVYKQAHRFSLVVIILAGSLTASRWLFGFPSSVKGLCGFAIWLGIIWVLRIADLYVDTFISEFRIRSTQLDRKVSSLIDARASMSDYLAEQAAWKTTERLDGRTDDEIETEYNPESHDLVVKGIKCVEVANDYECGNSVPRNQELAKVWLRRAVPWYELAAKKGDSYAQEKLGDFWSEGRGVQRDDSEALYWWRESAHRGRASAQYRLGEKYYFGKNVEKNLAEALFWFDVVIMSHSAGFVELKRQAASYRDDAAQHLTPAELTQVQERARKWLEDHPAKPQ